MKTTTNLYSMDYRDIACTMETPNGVLILPPISSLPEYRLGTNYYISAPLGAYIVKTELTNEGTSLQKNTLIQYTTDYVDIENRDNLLVATSNNSKFKTTFSTSINNVVYSEYEVQISPEKVEIDKTSTINNIKLSSASEISVGDKFLCYDNDRLTELTVQSFSSSASSAQSEWRIAEITTTANITNLSKIIFDGTNYIALQGLAVSSNKIYRSIDGESWTEIELPIRGFWSSITYSNGIYVLVSASSNIILHSTNLLTWFRSFLPVNANWQDSANGNGKFVITGNNTQIASVASTPTAWERSILPSIGNWQSVAYGNGKFVTIMSSNSQNKVYATSVDGSTWVKGSLPYITSNAFVKYENNLFFIVLKNSKKLLVSQDGTSWSLTDLPIKADWVDIAYGNNQYVMVSTNGKVLSSTDGVVWIEEVLSVNTTGLVISSMCFGLNKFVIISSNSDKIIIRSQGHVSHDGIIFDKTLSSVPKWLIRSGRDFKIYDGENYVTPHSLRYSYNGNVLKVNYSLANVSGSTSTSISLLNRDVVTTINVKFMTSQGSELEYLPPNSEKIYFSDGQEWLSANFLASDNSHLQEKIASMQLTIDALVKALSQLTSTSSHSSAK